MRSVHVRQPAAAIAVRTPPQKSLRLVRPDEGRIHARELALQDPCTDGRHLVARVQTTLEALPVTAVADTGAGKAHE
jgi:hypothetical protein